MTPFFVPGPVAIVASTSRWRLECYWRLGQLAALCCWFSPDLAVAVLLKAFRVIEAQMRLGNGAVRPLTPEVVRAALFGPGVETSIEVQRWRPTR